MKRFLTTLHSFYKTHKRDSLPWRKTRDAYKILVSEVMLQQTQVSRVLIKYKEFLHQFPTADTLAQAKLSDVLKVWQGLGYNRRAKFLYEASKVLSTASKKDLADYNFLLSLPGVGQSTAGAVLAFTQNKPVVFIETNIRAIILHHFFKDAQKVSDKEIYTVVEKLLTRLPTNFSVRDFYYALYDYGVHLKSTLGKAQQQLHKRSTHYSKQSRFTGSRRQLRAFILKKFLDIGDVKKLETVVYKEKPKSLSTYTKEDIKTLITELNNEGFFIH